MPQRFVVLNGRAVVTEPLCGQQKLLLANAGRGNEGPRAGCLKVRLETTSLNGPALVEVVVCPLLAASYGLDPCQSTSCQRAMRKCLPPRAASLPSFTGAFSGRRRQCFPVSRSTSVPASQNTSLMRLGIATARRGMLTAHPELRDLFGNTRSTAIWCFIFAAAQIALSVLAGSQPLWLVTLIAYVVGSWINICLFMLAHECNHGLVFNNKKWDRWLFTITTLPMFMAGHHTWWVEHHVHHNELGGKKDFVRRRRSIFLLMKDKLAGIELTPRLRPLLSWVTTPLVWPISLLMLVTQLVRACIGLAVYAVSAVVHRRWAPNDLSLSILADEHLVSGYKRYRITSWAVIYPLLNISLLGLLWAIAGPKSFVYLLLSSLFFTGFLHPLMFGLILSNSHFHGHRCYQPSSSYYGWLNKLTFNFGLHTEHHDLEAVPWSRLDRVSKIARSTMTT